MELLWGSHLPIPQQQLVVEDGRPAGKWHWAEIEHYVFNKQNYEYEIYSPHAILLEKFDLCPVFFKEYGIDEVEMLLKRSKIKAKERLVDVVLEFFSTCK